MPLFCFGHLRTSDLQMRDIQMPLGSVGNKNVAVRPMRVSDFVNFHVRRQNVHYYRLVQRNYAGAEFFAPYELTLRRIHRKEISFHADQRPFVSFHCADEMSLRVTLEKLSMNDVNVFANINDHKFIGLCFAFPRACPAFRFEKGTNSNNSPH
jgi:hypothetical protein